MALTLASSGGWSVAAEQVVEYEVRPIENVLDQTFEIPDDGDPTLDVLGRARKQSPRRLVVIDREVEQIYGDKIYDFLNRHGVEYRPLVLPGGEATKTMRTVFRICRELDSFGVARRSEPLIVFGGGVLNDVGGMAASIYRRGIERIVYGTTLVALVDASVGAKVASDYNGYKNRLGTYRPARLIIADRRFLGTQDRRRLADGLSEILKLGIVCDSRLFELLEKRGATVLNEKFQGETEPGDKTAVAILEAAMAGMLSELHENLWEDQLARATYFGHTWSPKIEMRALELSRARLPWRRRAWLMHGEAVALDMVLSVLMACRRGLVTGEECERIVAVAKSLELPTWDPLLDDSDTLAAGLEDSIRHRDGKQLVPLPRGIGGVTFANDISHDEIAEAVEQMRSLGGQCLA
ncbi:sedoheptulose 7-phosphate cyclase [Amycolatopsis alkalitolerans]|uniref:sedoheptulose 7-phosphate cyclase n=1 Tax=Amycolatopsis alkalitolerans TaxID=2547244 RepID=UPI001F1F09AB|nr:sedoheptulose 7-phosphate cyclase [Amycolatopsis alkalitolerans]